MYLTFYQLKAKPFNISADPRFFWHGEKHSAALFLLKSGLLDKNGDVVLTGDIGTGKTTLVNALIETLDPHIPVAKIAHTTLEALEFLSLVANRYDPTIKIRDRQGFWVFFESFLQRATLQNRSVLLVIDEAHRLPAEVLKEIRRLSNRARRLHQRFQMVWVGQYALNPMLLLPECRDLRSRITLAYDLQPLTANETRAYITHRLKVAGTRDNLFTSPALDRIHDIAQGYPRLINTLCERALLTGYVRKAKTIEVDIVAECAGDISLLQVLPVQADDPPAKVSSSRSSVSMGPDPERDLKTEILHRAIRLRDAALDRVGPFTDALRRRVGPFAKARPWMLIPALPAAAILLLFLSMDGELKNKSAIYTPSASSGHSTALELAISAMKQHNYTVAIELLEADPTSGGVDPDEARIVYAQALAGRAVQVMESMPGRAEEIMQKAVAVDPANADHHLNLGKLYTRNQKFSPAIDAYQEAVALNPDLTDALFNLGYIYVKTGIYPEAERYFARAVQLKPEYLDQALFNLALVQEKLGKTRESRENMRAALAVRPDNVKIQTYLNQMERSTPKEL